MIIYKNKETGEKVDILEFNIRQGWLNKPQKIKDDLYYMKFGYAEMASNVITKYVFERLLKVKGFDFNENENRLLTATNYNERMIYMYRLSELTKRFNYAIDRRDRIAQALNKHSKELV
jgi:hypothetical protein